MNFDLKIMNFHSFLIITIYYFDFNVNFSLFSERGRVYVFGNNEWGQLGLGHTKASNKPAFIKSK